MGKNKKKFIAKGEGEKFYLLHRSKTDEAHASEGVPSTFVLVKAGENGNDARRHSRVNDLFKSRADHVTSQGFLNDGYDYSQHLQELGGGHFIGRDGKARDSSSLVTSSKIALPTDLLPSEGELERHFDSITISPDCMDPDIAEALFGDAADATDEDWVLDDDFVAQAAAEPETPDFDFDAHIAALIERSERSTGMAAARGWDKKHPEPIPENDSDYCSSYASEDEDDNAEQPNDDDFDKLLAEYGDDALGDLEDEVGEIDLEGAIDLEKEDPLLQAAMREMIEEQRDFALCNGVQPLKGVRDLDDSNSQLTDEQLKQQVQEFVSTATAPLVAEEESEEEARAAIQSVAYLAEEREIPQWDCESVLSTYSTLDNHPSLIRIDKRKPKSKPGAATKSAAAKSPASPAPIVLAGKHMLPQGYGITKKQQPLETIADESDESENEEDRNRRKGETPQQRKERKQRVKAERREKRAHKKQLKNAFQSETVRLHTITGVKQDTDHTSVYRYSTA